MIGLFLNAEIFLLPAAAQKSLRLEKDKSTVMIETAERAFDKEFKSTPATAAFLRADNLRRVHAEFQHALDAAYRAYGQEAPSVVLDDSFVQDAAAFAQSRLHVMNNTAQDMNAHFIDGYIKPLTAQLYWTQRSRTHLDEAASCGRSQVYRRYYSNKQVPFPELPPTPQQLPSLSTAAYQTGMFRYPLSSRSQQRRQEDGQGAVPGISAYARGV